MISCQKLACHTAPALPSSDSSRSCLAQQPSGAIDISAQHAQQRLVVRTFCEQSRRACGRHRRPSRRGQRQRRLWTENPINMDVISFTWSSDKSDGPPTNIPLEVNGRPMAARVVSNSNRRDSHSLRTNQAPESESDLLIGCLNPN